MLFTACQDHGNPQPSLYTTVPDINFERFLIEQRIDDVQDGRVLTANAQKVTNSLFASGRNISSLAGLEAFTNLTGLYCNGNNLASLDVSRNTKLDVLYCQNNRLTTIDISKNTTLIFFDCSGNKLTTLDVSKNTALGFLACLDNSIQTICVNSLNQVKLGWLKDATATYQVCP